MKTRNLLLGIFCLALFASCTEELKVEQEYTKISSAQYLKNLDQPFVFQIVQLDDNEEWQAGWVIDFEGNIHEFSIDGRLAQNQENMDCPGTFMMTSLLNYTDGVIGQVDLDELASNFKKLNEIKVAGTSEYKPETPSSLAYYGLTKNNNSDHYLNNASCDANGQTSFEYSNVNYIVLDKATPDGVRSNSPIASKIIEWMEIIDADL